MEQRSSQSVSVYGNRCESKDCRGENPCGRALVSEDDVSVAEVGVEDVQHGCFYVCMAVYV